MHNLFNEGVGKVIATDIDASREAEIKAEFAGKNFELRIVARGDNSVLFEKADAVCPCATGALLLSIACVFVLTVAIFLVPCV